MSAWWHELWLHVAIGIVPVVVLLIVFDRLDAFKLVPLSTLAAQVAAGAGLAALGYLLNGGMLDTFPVELSTYTRIHAPIIEELLKASVIVALFAANRVGYMVDAAILGLAVGTGFALAENAFFLWQFTDATLGVWVVRGFGTALMHAGATAIMATLSYQLFARRLRLPEDQYRFALWPFVPGTIAAILIHALFNQFTESALLAMAAMVVAVPVALTLILNRGEVLAHDWLAADAEAHAHLVADIRSGAFRKTPQGRALSELAERLGPARGAELTEFVALHAELVARADQTLLALEAHRHLDLGPAIDDQFRRFHQLERSLGPSVLHAVHQHLKLSRDDLWKLHELEVDAHRHLD